MRSDLLRSLRAFFYDQDFIEIDTPVALKTPALEDYIDAIPAGFKWLRTSPELHMKRLLVAGHEKIFQLGSCFREGEFGARHREEFTMLEWYEAGGDYLSILEQTKGLLRKISSDLDLRKAYFEAKWQVLTVNEAFEKYAGLPAEEAIAKGEFEETLCFKVEPHLGKDVPTILIDYPASLAALSKKKKDDSNLAERWELYVDGLEIANAYSELTDPDEQLKRFRETAKLRSQENREVYEIDQDFMEALLEGMPESGGIAVGIDRLCMAMLQVEDISEVVFD
ncbi:MAG: EF-P lysine aminoacylase EpmA [Lentisphaeraceae bacterium]|nr:EF-P lysine aminoacylase EpmA [Lentisphaeraceae bacterium]